MSDGPVFGSPAAFAVLCFTRIVKYPKLTHMDAPEPAVGLLGLYVLKCNTGLLQKQTWFIFVTACSVVEG